MSNSGKATLENSTKGDIDFELIGGTEQLTTTGKNIFDESKAVTGRINPDNGELLPETSYISSDYIEVQEGETYFQSGSGDGYYRAFYDMNKKFTSIPTKGIFKITVPVGSKFLRISGRKERFGDWMIEKGDKATSYEPYTGGKPSPSPEYPQEIESAGKWNEETQKYEVDVKVTGKNLFDQSKLISGFINMTTGAFEESANTLFANSLILDKPILLKSGQTLVTSVADRFAQNFLRYRTYRKDGTFLINNEPISFSYKATEDLYVIALFYNGMSEEDKKSLQIEISDTSTTYEPYTEQTLTLTSDRPITKWDRLVEQGGQYGWLYKHRIVNDLSALVKDSEPIYGKDGEKYFSVSLQGALFNYDYNKIYSVAGMCTKDNKIHYVPKPMIQSVIIYVSDTDTIMTAKEHMHYKVIYETTESQFIPLSESEQTQLRNLHSYNGTTNITVDSGEVECGIKVAYKQNK